MGTNSRLKTLKRRGSICNALGLLSFAFGELGHVKDPVINNMNTAFGIAVDCYGMVNAFRMIDELGGADGDDAEMIKHLGREFVVAPIRNSLLLSYSLAPAERKKELRAMIGLI